MNVRPYLTTAALVVLGMLLVSLWAWSQIPADAQVPIHWGIDGRANGWAPKPIALLGLPLLTVGLALLLAFAPRLDPRYANVQRSATAYWAIAFGSLALLAVVHVAAILVATGRSVNIGTVVSVAVGVLFVVVGNFLGKTRSSWIFGIRTPWTLSSERSWAKTHRLGGYLFILLGVLVVLVAIVAPGAPDAFVLLGGLALVILAVVSYSYLVWRDDPDRQRIGAN